MIKKQKKKNFLLPTFLILSFLLTFLLHLSSPVLAQDDEEPVAASRKVNLVGRIYGFSRENLQDTVEIGGTPISIAQNSKGNLYIVYSGQKEEIQVFDAKGKFLFAFGEKGDAKEAFSSYICGLAINSRDEVYVCDVLKKKILVFDSRGKFQFSFSSVQGLTKEDKRQDTSPSHIAIDARDRVYISDTANGHVWVHDRTGKYLFPLGGPEEGRFPTAGQIRFDKNKRIYIQEGLANQIQVCDPMGKPLFTIGKPGSRVGQFLRISGLAIDSKSNLYVTDIVLSVVQVFDSQGKFLGVIKHVSDKKEEQEFKGLSHIFIGQNDLIYLTELPFHRVTVIKDTNS